MSKTEHILLESDDREVPEPHTARKVHAGIRLRSPLRRRVLELRIIDYYYLVVRTWRARSTASEYVLDLRFIEHSLRQSRHIPWRWMTATLALATLAAASGALVGLSSGAWWRHDLLAISATLFGLTACAGLVSVYRTTETLGIYSVDGQARLLEFTGGLGTFRAFRPFMLKLAAHLRIAVAARRSSRAGHLRDEMREHFRLKEAGVLSNEEYEESKMRILGAHARG